MNRHPHLHWSLLGALLLLLIIASISAQALAQTSTNDSTTSAANWASPQNLSMSGAASDPAFVLVPDGTMRVFWWDQFDGTMVADGILTLPVAGEAGSGEPEAWSSPIGATIQLSETVEIEGEDVTVRPPIGTVPRIIGDASGRAHAFWLGESDEESGDTPLLYSRLNPGSTRWSVPASLATSAGSFAVAADGAGAVHLVYVQVEPAPGLPAGLHYRRLPAGGFAWTTPTAVHRSRYVRLLSPDEDVLRLTADDEGNLYAAWMDVGQRQILLAQSADEGATWSEPEAYLGSGIQPEQDRVIALPGSQPAVLWAPAGEEDRGIAASAADNALRLAAWDGERWLETAEQYFHLEDPETSQQVRLHELRLVLVPASAGEEGGVEKLAVIGLDDNRDLWITGAGVDALEDLLARTARDEESSTGAPAPVNLSRNGTGSNPAIVARSGDTLYAFWDDQFDGLTMAEAVVVASTRLTGTEEIRASDEIWSEPRALPPTLPGAGGEGGESAVPYSPVDGVPQMVVDASGGIHAFWSGEETASSLMYSQLAQDASAWSWPVAVAEPVAAFDVAASSSGALHMAYIETGSSPASPAGVYYRRLEPGRIYWTAPIPLQQSRSYRQLGPETAHLRLATDETGSVYVTWDEPQQGGLMLARSGDGGVAWQETMTVDAAGEGAQRGRLISVPQGDTLLLWEDGAAAGSCRLLQVAVGQVLEGGAVAGRPVLEGLGGCPDDEELLPLGEGQVLMVLGSGSDALTLAVWDESPDADAYAGAEAGQWSEPSRLAYSFEEPASGRRVYLGDLRVALVNVPGDAGDGLTGKALVAVGTDQEGDVWATSSATGALELVFAPPSPWPPPEGVYEGEAYADLPAMAADGEGRVHALWAEAASAGEPPEGLVYARWDGEGWTPPAQVLQCPEGGIGEPDLVVQGERLHAVWSCQEGVIYHSYAFAQDAYTAGGWSEPGLVSEARYFADQPDLVVDADGVLHAVFAVPVNEGRGIYYTRSADGEVWEAPSQVFDAAEAGWMAVGQPQLAVDAFGFLHVAWVQAPVLSNALPDGVYYARSLDGGERWSEAMDVTAGAYGWPQVVTAAEGRVHLVWREASERGGWWHRYSSDAGETWEGPERVAGFEDVVVPVRLMADDNGALHLAGLEPDRLGSGTLLHATWDGGRWSSPEAFRLEVDGVEEGLGASLAPALRRLDVMFRSEGQEEDGTAQAALWYTGRDVPVVAVTPAPVYVPQPTPTPLPTASPAPTAMPTPDFGDAPGTGEEPDLFLPILLAGGLAALLIVGAIAATRLVRARRK